MTIRVSRDEQLVLQEAADVPVRVSRTEQQVLQNAPDVPVRLGRVEMLVFRSIADGPVAPPVDPPVEPPAPAPEPARASILRRSDVTAVLNEFGVAIQDLLTRYADSGDSGFGTRSLAIDLNGYRIINSGTTQAGFDAVPLSEVQAALP